MRRGLGNNASMMRNESDRSDLMTRRSVLRMKKREDWLTSPHKRKRSAKLRSKNRNKSSFKCKSSRKLVSNALKRKKGFVN
jgi:hypothetical protein